MIPVELQVIGASLRAIAEEMGAALIRSAFSANIKERRDCSTALFDERGRMVTQAEHIPVHLGAMPEAVAAVMAHDPAPAEPWILNDPYAGGTHLPDLTIVTRTALGYAVTRAHHADVGGSEPGSLPPESRTLAEEGVIIPPTRLDGRTLDLLVERMRNPDERRGDLPGAAGCAPARRGTRVRALRAARPRPCRRGDGRAARVLRAGRARRHPRAPGRPLRGRRPPRDACRAARHRGGCHHRGRLDRHRLRGDGSAVRREPELPARRHAVGLLLRRPLPHRAGPSGLRRRLRSGLGARARGLARQCARAARRRSRPGA